MIDDAGYDDDNNDAYAIDDEMMMPTPIMKTVMVSMVLFTMPLLESSQMPSSPASMPAYCVRLRKYLSNFICLTVFGLL
jgi:hypothetical protein